MEPWREHEDLLAHAHAHALRYLTGLGERAVAPGAKALARLEELDVPLSDDAAPPSQVLEQLDDIGSPATMATAGPRFFGLVVGGALPVAVAAQWLAAAWDQNAALASIAPGVCALEAIAGRWVTNLLGLTGRCSFVTGTTAAHVTALAAARHHVLARTGWDVEQRGLAEAPRVRLVVGDEAHPTVLRAVRVLGLGLDSVVRVPVDDQGRMRADALPKLGACDIVCLQAGNVNTGAFDPAAAIIPIAKGAGAWVHVDGAFGLWAAASPEQAHLFRGFEEAHSWSVDGHKWLNTPYDVGMAIVREPDDLRRALAMQAAYLVQGNLDPADLTIEMSRRARGVEVWAALRSLGRSGVADLVSRTCRFARRFAERLSAAGYTVLNDVCLNQVLVSFGDEATTRAVIARVQADGTCWCGGTTWQGNAAMRISVSSWATTEADVDRSIDAILRVAGSAHDAPTSRGRAHG